MSASSDQVAKPKSQGASRISNGSHVLPGCDGRSVWARRFRDLIEIHVTDLGGPSAVSAAEKSIIRRASTLEVELERMELTFAVAGEASTEALDIYQRTANSLRRLLEATGLKRVPRDVTSLGQILREANRG